NETKKAGRWPSLSARAASRALGRRGQLAHSRRSVRRIDLKRKERAEARALECSIARLLALRERERAAGLGLAILLALDHTAVAGEEAAPLEHGAQIRFEVGQRLGDTVTHGAGLARQTAARHGADDV